MKPAQDPHALQRFVDAQRAIYAQVETELRAGRKESHWMWYISEIPVVDDAFCTCRQRQSGLHGCFEEILSIRVRSPHRRAFVMRLAGRSWCCVAA
jgi:Protein of unknown function (DUF1810)